MTGGDLRSRLQAGAKEFGLALGLRQLEQLSQYLAHLERWNRTINLTALPLTGYPAATLDRLIFEPLRSAAVFPVGPFRWLDFGSGGGSPAIPLRIVLPDASLTMVESRSRKAAFLRDVVRTLTLPRVEVIWDRIEGQKSVVPRSADVVTVRALRIDADVAQAIDHVVCDTGRVVLFGSVDSSALAPQFSSTAHVSDVGDVTVLRRRSM
jgi:16S rRNA (guanine(527)-N(7))-methyltransferase RsmG